MRTRAWLVVESATQPARRAAPAAVVCPVLVVRLARLVAAHWLVVAELGGGGGSGGVIDPGPLTHPDQRTVVYLPDWRGTLASWTPKIDYSRISYLNLSFATVDAAGNVSYPDAGLDAFVAAAHAKGE